MPERGNGRRLVLSKRSETDHRPDRGTGSLPAFLRGCLSATLGGLFVAILTCSGGSAHAETRALKLYNTHTKERATIVYKRNGKYDRAGLAKVNHFLRDWRQNEPTKMDPQLLDLVWAVYQQTGSDDYIHVISAYRSPATNNMLRKRSSGVAKKSQHIRGKAMDFYIPDVPLAKLRAIGLRAQVGGVGYYPTSGSPFVHMDTGSVRHWPRMSRQQLVKVFPDGKTLHVPRDGGPLPGYAQALAAHKLRGSKNIEVASFEDNEDDDADKAPLPPKRRKPVGDPVVIASVSDETDDGDLERMVEPPLPRPSPVPVVDTPDAPAPAIVATAQPVPQSLQPRDASQVAFASIGNTEPAPRAAPRDFETASHWSSPSVPADLARAMAERDISRPTSLPIRPTAVVATVDVTRPLRAEAMTSAVIQAKNDTMRDVTPVFAYAAMEPSAPAVPQPRQPVASPDPGMPVPVANPLRTAAAPVAPAVADASPTERPVTHRLPREDLTLTALDTLALRLWMARQSTRQKQYAVLTMPDFSQVPSLIDKPTVVYSVGFDDTASQNLRTDRFSGPLVQLPDVVDLEGRQRLANR